MPSPLPAVALGLASLRSPETFAPTDEPLRSSPRLPSTAIVVQGSGLPTPSLALPHSATAHRCCSHRRNGRTCGHVAPIPCPTHRAECSTATARVVHLAVFLLSVRSSTRPTSFRLVGSGVSDAVCACL